MSEHTNIDALAEHLAISPVTVIEHSFDLIEKSIGGTLDIVDGYSPFVELLEIGAIQVAAMAQKMDATTRRRYRNLATNMSELYPHMSDSDFVGLFAAPVRNHIITMGFSIQQIKQYAKLDSKTGLKRVRIPKDTVIEVYGKSFMFHQPIDITVYSTGDISAKFDSTFKSMLLTRESNSIVTRTGKYEGVDYFILDIPCDQISVVNKIQAISKSNSWFMDVPFTNKFYGARGYFSKDGTEWVEMHTTYDENLYDPTNPTMVLTVNNGSVNARIPDVFIHDGKVGITARVEVYTTLGKQTIELANAEQSDWVATWNDFGGTSDGFSDMLEQITSRIVFSTNSSIGGSDGMAFMAAKEKLIYGQGNKDSAFTELELKQALKDRGYTTSLRKNTLSERIYVASTKVDNPNLLSATGLISGMGNLTDAVSIDPSRTDLTYGMNSNTGRTILKPDMLYEQTNGGTVPLTNDEVSVINQLSPLALVDRLNTKKYFYTPFYTVLDHSRAVFESRSYWLTSPKYKYLDLMDNNAALGYPINTKSIDVSLVDDKYVIVITSNRPKDSTGFVCQLLFNDATELGRYLTANSVLGKDTMSFTFELPTTFNINSLNQFDTKALARNDHALKDVYLALSQKFSIGYLVSTDTRITTDFDGKLVLDGYGDDIYSAVSYENTEIEFGKLLDGYFLMGRSIISTPVHATYASDVPLTYAEDVYEKEGKSNKIIMVDGKVTFNLLHKAGEQKTDDQGTLLWLHRKDEVKHINGHPIVVTPSSVIREIRMPLYDARFLFSTKGSITAYRNDLPVRINDLLVREIAPLRLKILENSKLYFEPIATQQAAIVKINDEQELRMQTALNFDINYQLTKEAYEDGNFRESLLLSTKEAIVTEIADNELTVAGLVSTLKKIGDNKIVNVTLNNSITTTGVAIIQDSLSNFSIAKKAVLEPNGDITMVDDIDITFTK